MYRRLKSMIYLGPDRRRWGPRPGDHILCTVSALRRDLAVSQFDAELHVYLFAMKRTKFYRRNLEEHSFGLALAQINQLGRGRSDHDDIPRHGC